MKPSSLARCALALLPLWAVGCASAGGAKSTGAVSKPAAAETSEKAPAATPSKANGDKPQLTPRAQRLFEEAVATPEEFRKLKVPVDWEVLERRWRAVLEAEEVPEAYYNLGVVLERRQRPDEARNAYAQALKLRPSFSQAAANLALLEEPSDPRQAAAAYQALLRKFPEDSVARVRLASLYYAAGQTDESWKLAREALSLDPKAIGAYRVMIRIALDRGNPDLAELITLRAQKIASPEQEAEFAAVMGDIQAKRGDDAAAAVQYRKALSIRPDEPTARQALLKMALKTENWDGVAEQARALLQKDGDNAKAHLALGVALRHQGKADEALAEYDKAQKLSSDGLPEVHLARGIALMKLKNTCEPAITEFKAYVAAAGALAGDSTAFQLQRECEQILAANRQAEEAARQMQAEADRKKAQEAAKAAKPAAAPAKGGAAPAKSGAAPAAAPAPSPEKKSDGVPPPSSAPQSGGTSIEGLDDDLEPQEPK